MIIMILYDYYDLELLGGAVCKYSVPRVLYALYQYWCDIYAFGERELPKISREFFVNCFADEKASSL